MQKLISHPIYEKWSVTAEKKAGVTDNLSPSKPGSNSVDDHKFTKKEKLASGTEMSDTNAELHNVHSHNSLIRFYKIEEAKYEDVAEEAKEEKDKA